MGALRDALARVSSELSATEEWGIFECICIAEECKRREILNRIKKCPPKAAE